MDFLLVLILVIIDSGGGGSDGGSGSLSTTPFPLGELPFCVPGLCSDLRTGPDPLGPTQVLAILL
jgi:hypothetical protein